MRKKRKPLLDLRRYNLKEIREHEDKLAEESSYDYDGLEKFRNFMRRASPERLEHGDSERR